MEQSTEALSPVLKDAVNTLQLALEAQERARTSRQQIRNRLLRKLRLADEQLFEADSSVGRAVAHLEEMDCVVQRPLPAGPSSTSAIIVGSNGIPHFEIIPQLPSQENA